MDWCSSSLHSQFLGAVVIAALWFLKGSLICSACAAARWVSRGGGGSDMIIWERGAHTGLEYISVHPGSGKPGDDASGLAGLAFDACEACAVERNMIGARSSVGLNIESPPSESELSYRVLSPINLPFPCQSCYMAFSSLKAIIKFPHFHINSKLYWVGCRDLQVCYLFAALSLLVSPRAHVVWCCQVINPSAASSHTCFFLIQPPTASLPNLCVA